MLLAPRWIGIAARQQTTSQRRFATAAFCIPLAIVAGSNFSRMRVDESDLFQPLLIEAAERDAVLVTHADRSNYHAIQTDNYYRLGLGLGASRGLEFRSAQELFFAGCGAGDRPQGVGQDGFSVTDPEEALTVTLSCG